MNKSILFLIFFLISIGCFSQKLTPEIEEYYHRKDFKGTIRLINEHIKNVKEKRDLLELRARCYTELKDYKLALNDYSEVVKNHLIQDGFFSTNSDLYIYRGQIHLHLKNFQEALDDFDSALEIGKNEPFSLGYPDLIYLAKGETYLATKSYDKAIQELTKLLEINKNHVGALHLRMTAYFKIGDKEKGCIDLLTAKQQKIKDELIDSFVDECRNLRKTKNSP